MATSTNKPRVSIVVPCYNCAHTLRQAVESCFGQGLEAGGFEVVMVDDGSTDGTRAVMEALAAERKEIRLAFHERNQGGGAARNTGIRAAEGSLIYCLDGDNFFAPNTVARMADFLDETKSDGIAFYERRFFSGDDAERYTPQRYEVLDRTIALGDLFLEDNVLLDNFLFTKASYEKTAGYPEHHGFDTQGFEMRYLAAGNAVRICPNTSFYHRQIGKTESYFEREYNAGNFSVNYYLCVEDIFHLFAPEAQDEIASYDIFANSSLKESLLALLKRLHAQGGLFATSGTGPTSPAGDLHFLARFIRLYRARDFSGALAALDEGRKAGKDGKILYYNAVRARRGLQGGEPRQIEKAAAAEVRGLLAKPASLYKPHQRNRFLSPIINLIRTCIAALRR